MMANTVKKSVVIVIPARYASTRLPGKPLADIGGKPMIQHVYERAGQVAGVDAVLVAVDDDRVAQAVTAFGGRWVMTRQNHESGTDRLAEVMAQYPADIYVNVQGDEPLVRPEDIAVLIDGMLADAGVAVGTLCHPLPAAEAANPNAVKVVLADNGDALYFSRSPIPYPRAAEEACYLKHVGVYAYRRDVLAQYGSLPQPMTERTEKLEQLRLLAAGFKIRAFQVAETGPGVDTPACLERVRSLMAGLPEKVASTPTLADVKLLITDVDGVYSADPRVVKTARKMKEITYNEMLEMARLGAGVMQPRSVELGSRYGVPIHVRSTFTTNPGTIIREGYTVEEKEFVVRGVTHDMNVAKVAVLGVPDRPGIAFKIFSALAEANIDVDMIVQSIRNADKKINDIVFTVTKGDAEQTRVIMDAVGKDLGVLGVVVDEAVAKVSIVGAGMLGSPGMAARMFGALSAAGINIEVISTSEISVSCLVREERAKDAVNAIHAAFFRDDKPRA